MFIFAAYIPVHGSNRTPPPRTGSLWGGLPCPRSWGCDGAASPTSRDRGSCLTWINIYFMCTVLNSGYTISNLTKCGIFCIRHQYRPPTSTQIELLLHIRIRIREIKYVHWFNWQQRHYYTVCTVDYTGPGFLSIHLVRWVHKNLLTLVFTHWWALTGIAPPSGGVTWPWARLPRCTRSRSPATGGGPRCQWRRRASGIKGNDSCLIFEVLRRIPYFTHTVHLLAIESIPKPRATQ